MTIRHSAVGSWHALGMKGMFPQDGIRSAGVIAAVVALAVMVSGCAGTPATTDAGTGLPAATGPASAPAEPTTPAATVVPAPPTGSPTGGCPANEASIPPGADTATIPDVDGDGRDDTEFYTEAQAPFEYGIRTASGATVILADDLAGPGRHSGWSARLEDKTVVTVLDDSRSATLHAFVACRFVTTIGEDGQPYRFLLNGFGDTGTGVACSTDGAGRELLGLLAKRNASGRYDVTATIVGVTADGLHAANGTSYAMAQDLPESDPQVQQAMGSHCGSIPKVATSGR